MEGILGVLNYYNFNDLKTASIELTHPIHASFFSSVNPNAGNW
jgi:hypothetical protein